MAITHANTAVTGGTGTAAQWNANHVIGDEDRPKVPATFVVAASDSVDATRADYVCDGTDDATEINAAIAALPAEGGKVTLLEGTFDLGARIEIQKDNVTLDGQGNGTVLVTAGGTQGIYSNGYQGMKIRDMYILGGAGGTGVERGIYLLNCTDAEIRSCWVASCKADGILIVNGGTQNMVRDCKVTSCTLSGIVVAGAYCSVIGCYAIGNTERGIYFSAAFGIVQSCIADVNGYEGILLAGVTKGARVCGCEADGNSGDGIKVQTAVRGTVIQGNYIIGNGATGISIEGSAADNMIAENFCYLNDGDGVVLAGAAANNIFTGNRSVSNGGSGMNITTAGASNIVVANRLQSLVTGGAGTEYGHNLVG